MTIKKEKISDDTYQTPMVSRAASQPISIASSDNTPPTETATNGASTEATSTDIEMDQQGDTTPADALENLGGHSRELIKAIQKIDALNIDSTLPPLPKIVVVGDQSAGKSSVIEAICDISLPRSGGTCTRCPFLITTSAATDGQPWSCRVSLHLKYSYQPGRKGGEHGFDNWSDEQGLDPRDFVTVRNKKDLEVTLRRAQLAILNPDVDHRQYIMMPVDQGIDHKRTVGFSPNIISLEITGENLSELSLYDLPGAINSTGRVNEINLVRFVEKLLKSYMRDEKAIILLASAANQDQETGTAYRYLIECFAQDRCMGVLTKPDLWMTDLTDSKVQTIRNILSNNLFEVGYGWFMTRQLSQAELNQKISYEEARRIEATFFDQQPWNTALAQYAERFGIPHLQKALSRKLTSEIISTLPEVVGRVQARIADVDVQLASFPEKAAAPSLSVIMDVDRVKSALLVELDADGDAEKTPNKFRKRYREIMSTFSKQLKELRPMVIVVSPGYVKPSISLDSDEEMEETPSKSRKTEKCRAMSATPNRAFASSSKTPSTGNKPRRVAQSIEELETPNRAVFRLDKVKEMYDSSSGADMGGAVDLKVNKQLMLDTVKGLGPKVESLLKKVHALFLEVLDNTLHTILSQRLTTRLFNDTHQIAKDLWVELIFEVAGSVRHLVACETHRPITYNQKLYAERKAHYAADLKNRRLVQRVHEYFEPQEADGYNVPKQSEWNKKAADANFVNNNLGPDVFDRELINLPYPLAYYDIASARLVDCVANQLELGLLFTYADRVYHKLLQDLQTGNNDRCALLLAEDEARERKRTDLLGEKGRLQQAIQELETLPGVHT